ncbi:hypothetical protein ABR738_00395 [Streptomyces sp. Edi4]|uniref:hypothetical protein n=1 Tax=Streptomyces sp. Edi4 TaxID=3162527 RepID=UPI0033063B98
MEQYEINWNDGNQDIAEAVMWAADECKPLLVTTSCGRTVRLIPEQAAPAEPADPLEGVAVQEVSRAVRELRRTTEYVQTLNVEGAPELSAGSELTALTPGIVWLEYVIEVAQGTTRLRGVHVSGYRARRTGRPDVVTSTSFVGTTLKDVPPWLHALAVRYAQA